MTRGQAKAFRRQLEARSGTLTDEEAATIPSIAPQWEQLIGETVPEGFRFAFGGKLYRVIEHGTDEHGEPLPHTFQAYWPPDQAPSLYARILPGQDGEIGEWVQPDSTNGYKKGDQVTHNGKTWESDVDNNVWEPGTTGAPWREVTA